MKDLMIDLETLGTQVNAPIVAVGACFFDIKTGEIGKTFDATIDLTQALRYGKMSGDTLKWWLSQGDEARQKVARGRSDPIKVYNAFCDFVASGGSGVRPWGNGASFDISMLEFSMARVIERTPPWDFWNIRDCRTIKHLATDMRLSAPPERNGVHHTALDDAIHQAEWVSHYWREMLGRPNAGQSAPAPVVTADIEDLLG